VLALDVAGTVIEFILGQGLIVGEKEEEPLFVDVVLVVVAEEFVRLALFVVKVLGSNEIASELVLAGSNPATDMLLITVVLQLG